jgi:hypothetical protein
MNLGKTLAQAPQDALVEVESQIRTETAYKMELPDAGRRHPLDIVPDLLRGHFVSGRIVLIAPISAKTATVDAEVRDVDVEVDDVRGAVSVFCPTADRGQAAQFKEVRLAKKTKPFFEGKASAGLNGLGGGIK